MSRALWKKIPDQELVKMLSTSGYLVHKKSNFNVYQNQLSGLYCVTEGDDLNFTYADGLTRAELIDYFDS